MVNRQPETDLKIKVALARLIIGVEFLNIGSDIAER